MENTKKVDNIKIFHKYAKSSMLILNPNINKNHEYTILKTNCEHFKCKKT